MGSQGRTVGRGSRRAIRAGLGALILVVASGSVAPVWASDTEADPIILQWFELSWRRMERRIPDFFMAGYGATWVAPISKASDPTSPGFDVFDRFDLGSPNVQGDSSRETIYGTEQGFRSVVQEFHRANGQVFVDSVMNHNSGRSTSSAFYAGGGYPGFWAGPGTIKTIGSGDWGDFHNGFFQSHDPGGGAGPYNLFQGDLVSLIDINQSSNNQYIRHPVESGNAQNIPAGTERNLPSAGNYRFYRDTDLAGAMVFNPGINRTNAGLGSFNTAPESTTVYPFNLIDPAQGDPVAENATGLLMRWSQWIMEEFGVDGFRLDAAKHIEPWFWDRYYDTYMFQRRRAPDGSFVTPFSFGECVEGPSLVHHYWVRKDGFGNRDALDLSNAGDVRNIIGAKGGNSIAGLNNNTLDVFDDGFNNGSVGVRHIHSHDNGSRGDGGSAPDYPYEDKIGFFAYAYMIMRPGPGIVYLNAREMHDRFTNRGGFWPREGVPTALGFGSFYTLPSNSLFTGADDRITKLVQLSNRYGRGYFIPRVSGDGAVYAYTRQTPSGVDNVLVAVNDEFVTTSSTYDERTFTTAFPQGSVLVELTGNATNALVDPGNTTIFDTITVGVGGQVTVRVPRNKTNAANGNIEHNRGYVVYGPATPNGVLTIVGAQQTLPPDSAGVAVYARRLASVDVVKNATFEIRLDTNQTGYPAGDTRFDDLALFRINEGFADYNGNGSFDVPSGEFRGYEGFLTQKDPIRVGGVVVRPNGVYRQTINTSSLPEGYSYISVPAFRDRSSGNEAGGLPLMNDFRRVIYVDRVAPEMELNAVDFSCQTGTATLRLHNPDRTVTRVHVFIDQPAGTPTLGNQATPFDRLDWTFSSSGLSDGMHTANILAFEEPSTGVIVNQSVTSIQFEVGVDRGDVNLDSEINIEDLYAQGVLAGFQCEADMNASGVVDATDRKLLQQALRQNELADITTP